MQPQIYDNEESERGFTVDNPTTTLEGVGPPVDPLALDIPDEELVKISKQQVKDDKAFWEKSYNLNKRRDKNEKALFGRVVQEQDRNNELKKYESRYSNNKLYEIEETLKPVAMSHLPDLIVTPGSQTPEAQQSAEDITKLVNDDLKKRDNRRVLGLGFRHLPVYFTAIIKVRWNPQKGDKGDYEFYIVNPERVVIDHTAKSNNADDMRVISELVGWTIQEVIMRFPTKKQDFFDELTRWSPSKLSSKDGFTWKDMATVIDLWEQHFTWYKRADTGQAGSIQDVINEPGVKWEKVEGVLWRFEDLILAKMKTPNYDYEGEEKWFTYDDPNLENSRRELQPEEAMMAALTGIMPPNVQSEQIYYNYFQAPRKPYFFYGYDQWGKVAIDETSRIEQNLYNQDNLNAAGKQINETLKTRTKHIWSTDTGFGAEDVQNMDMENPRLDALVDGDVNKVHKDIQPERPDAAQFNYLKMSSDDMFSLAGATALTGQITTDVATTNQIAREQNFTRADDLVEETINAASEWMAQWSMQFIKLRYTEDHFRKLLGIKGTITFLKIKRDQIDDGMEVMIKASGTDKLKAQHNAMDAAKLGAPYVNPLDFFKDMEYTDPEGRTERGMIFATNPQQYLMEYGMGMDIQAQTQALGQAPVPGAQPVPGGQAPGGIPPQGGIPGAPPPTSAPVAPNPADTQNVAATPPTGAPVGSPRGI